MIGCSEGEVHDCCLKCCACSGISIFVMRSYPRYGLLRGCSVYVAPVDYVVSCF